MTDYTIANEYTLPSLGKVYDNEMNPVFKIRSMTTAEEMKRLNHSDRPYKLMSEIIDDCLVTDIGMSAYDLCVADYQFMLHKLRIVTYGPMYKVDSTCPYCGSVNKSTINLDNMKIIPFDEESFKRHSEFVLPSTEKHIKLRVQTPRVLDDTSIKTKDERRSQPGNNDAAFLFTLKSLIKSVDDQKMEEFKLIEFLRRLPMIDTNYIMKSAQKIATSFGIDSVLSNTCKFCGLDYNCNFRTTSEFFGPSID